MIDSHIHLCDERYVGEVAEVIARAKAAGIDRFIMPGADDRDHARIAHLAQKFEGVAFATVGLHPTYINDNPQWREHLQNVENLLKNPPVRYYAIGETGMDLHWSQDFVPEQKEGFRFHIELAIEHDLPLILHCREAWAESFEVLEPYAGRVRGVFHSFAGGRAEVERIEAMGGFYYGINGTLTFKNSTLPEVLPYIPQDKLLFETDGPYLAPMPHRGKRNESSYISYIASRAAEILGVPTSILAEATTRNTEALFF